MTMGSGSGNAAMTVPTSLVLLAIMLRLVSPFHLRRALVRVAKRSEFLASTISPEPASSELFNPIGPPIVLLNLEVGETCSMPSSTITRLSRSPDLFYIKDFIIKDDREVLMHAASEQGMKTAGTRSSEANTIRKNSYLTWIDPYDISGATSTEALSIARNLILKAEDLFAHESMHKVIKDGGRVEYFFAEDLQVAKYDTDGCFNFHHDGFSRYLSKIVFVFTISMILLPIPYRDFCTAVLIYINGIGGTYFPFANLGNTIHDVDAADEASAVEIATTRVPGKDGILLVGTEDAEYYHQSSDEMDPNSVIKISAGDAIAFYSYKPNGEKDWRSLHCSLAVPQEKWISTCWFRSEALTGPFGYMKKEAMLGGY
jgi:hypothetical protein